MINAYNQFALPKYWGSGKRASADGTKWSLYEQNLLSEYHVRYGGYGGIGYYHVSDMYIALFSQFIPCGVHEAVYILDGLIQNGADIKPDTIHGDTQAQSGPPVDVDDDSEAFARTWSCPSYSDRNHPNLRSHSTRSTTSTSRSSSFINSQRPSGYWRITRPGKASSPT